MKELSAQTANELAELINNDELTEKIIFYIENQMEEL